MRSNTLSAAVPPRDDDADDGLLGGTLLQRDDFDIMLKNAKTKGKNVSYWHLLLC